MPSKNWLEKNPKVSAHIPQELYQQLQEFMEQNGIQKNAEALKIILNEYFNSKVDHSEHKSRPLVDYSVVNQLTTLESKIDKISEQIDQIAKSDQKAYSSPPVDHSKQKSRSLVVYSSPLTNSEGWLTTGEAFNEAKRRGYSKAKGSFGRGLRSGSVPADLERLGLVANWGVRQQANLKDNSVRWLRFEDGKTKLQAPL